MWGAVTLKPLTLEKCGRSNYKTIDYGIVWGTVNYKTIDSGIVGKGKGNYKNTDSGIVGGGHVTTKTLTLE